MLIAYFCKNSNILGNIEVNIALMIHNKVEA